MTRFEPDTPMKTSAPAMASASSPVRFSLLVFSASQRRSSSRLLVVGRDDPPAVEADDVADALGEEQLADGDARRAHAEHHDPHVLHPLAHHAQRVQQRGEDDDRGAVLVVVEHRDVEQLAQAAFDLEAARRRDVLEVDPSVDRGDALDDAHDLVDVLGGEADRPRVDAGEALEEQRLALHHGQCRLGSDVAESEHRRAVGHDGHGVALDRELASGSGILRRSPSRSARRRGCRPSTGRRGS